MSQKEIDHAIRTTFRNPPILASEDRAQYEHLKRLVLSDIKPRGLQETLLARHRGGRVGGLSAAVDEGCHPPRRIAARDQIADLGGRRHALPRSAFGAEDW